MASTVVSLGGESGSSEVMEGIRLDASDIPGLNSHHLRSTPLQLCDGGSFAEESKFPIL